MNYKYVFEKMFILCLALLHLLNIPASSSQDLEISANVPDEELYKELQRRSSSYGTCWKTTLDKLNTSCNDFSEEQHSHLALSFSNCFLINAGMTPCLCKERVKISECLKNCSDRVFNVFTEFYTHTKSICHFLHQKNFQVESIKLQLMLKRSSTDVKELLEKAVEDQSASLKLQKELLNEQQKSIDNGKELSKEISMTRKQANDLHLDFKKSLIEQSKLVVELFEKLTKIHTFIVGSLSLLYSSLFYGTVIICIYTFTTIPSTAGARVSLFLILLVNVIAEYIVTTCTLHYTNAAEDVLDGRIWLCRKITSGLCLLFLVIKWITYEDKTLTLLKKIEKQNEEIISLLKDFVQAARENTAPVLEPQNAEPILEAQNHAPVDQDIGHPDEAIDDVPQNEEVANDEPQNEEMDPVRKLKKIEKKLKEVVELKEKVDAGIVVPNADQQRKLDRWADIKYLLRSLGMAVEL